MTRSFQLGASDHSAALVLRAALDTLVFMCAFEATKERFFPGLTHWGSHVITIALTTTLVTAASILAAARQKRALAEVRKFETRQVALIGQLEDALRVREEFMSFASHELRTPLASLDLQTQFLLNLARTGALGTLPRDKLMQLSDHSGEQLKRLQVMVTELLDVTRLSAGQFDMPIETFDLAAETRRVANSFGADFEKARCALSLDLPPHLFVKLNRSGLERVMVNLLGNALKYGVGKPIEITLGTREGQVRLEVRDHGVGIRREDQKRIFERFERGAAREKFEGLGLGLYICRQIVELLGGSIEVTSRPDEGATFIVTLPREAGRPARTPDPGHQQAS